MALLEAWRKGRHDLLGILVAAHHFENCLHVLGVERHALARWHCDCADSLLTLPSTLSLTVLPFVAELGLAQGSVPSHVVFRLLFLRLLAGAPLLFEKLVLVILKSRLGS